MNIQSLMTGVGPATALLKLLANRHRLMILCSLGDGEKSVGELVEMAGLSQSALSQHLAKLRDHDLVRTRRQAQTIFYALSSTEVVALIELLESLFCAAPSTPAEMTQRASNPFPSLEKRT